MLRSRQCGISLIEIMVALAIIGVMVLVAIPAFSAWIANLKVRAVTEGVTAGLQLARVEAAKRATPVRFRLDSATGGSWTVLVVDGGAVIESKTAGQGGTVDVVMAPNDANSIDFNALGQRIKPAAAEQTVTVTVTNPASGTCQTSDGNGGAIRCLHVQIPVGGQVRMCDPIRPDGDPQACI